MSQGSSTRAGDLIPRKTRTSSTSRQEQVIAEPTYRHRQWDLDKADIRAARLALPQHPQELDARPRATNALNYDMMSPMRRTQIIRQISVSLAQRSKHAVYVQGKKLGWRINEIIVPLLDPPFRFYQNVFPRPYVATRYSETFLAFSAPPRDFPSGEPIDRVVYVAWTGTNPMPAIRAKSLHSWTESNPEITVRLVTPHNLSDYTLPDHPFHEAYPYLSLTHKSDYLRAYLLHHHGGGYADLKRPLHNWESTFREMERSDLWLAGYPELSFSMVPKYKNSLGRDLQRVSNRMIGHGAYIAKKRTPLTEEWLRRQHEVLDENLERLRRHPGGVRAEVADYPIKWLDLLAGVLSPLVYKYEHRVRLTTNLHVDLEQYR